MRRPSPLVNLCIYALAFLLSAGVVLLLWNWLAVPAVARSIDYSEALVIQAVFSALGEVSRWVESKVGEPWRLFDLFDRRR